MTLPRQVRIVEVGPRDGLQNEKGIVPTPLKIELIERLAAAGLRHIEATAFVAPSRVPQMADNSAVLQGIRRRPGVAYPVLTPNLQGFDAAVQAGAEKVAVFAAASESFSRHNINCSIAESLKRFEPVLSAASALEIPVRGYVSCVVGCPVEGTVEPRQAAGVARALIAMGCYEVSLGDTLGVGNPASITRLIEACARDIPLNRLAGHYHDTYGMAIANIHASLQAGISTFDASVAGLGGCPYARGASGNVASEDVAYLLAGLGIESGIDLAKLAAIGDWISTALNRPNGAKAGRALCARSLDQPAP
jgi:hydroxymethylglutaryl-CoA lyase